MRRREFFKMSENRVRTPFKTLFALIQKHLNDYVDRTGRQFNSFLAKFVSTTELPYR